MERQKGRCGKADSEGSHPQGETRDLRMEWESSRCDEAYVCAGEEEHTVSNTDFTLCYSSAELCTFVVETT